MKIPADRGGAFVSIAESLGKTGDVPGSVKLIARAIAIAERLEDVDTRDDIYYSIALAQARVGEFRNALSTAERIKYPSTRYHIFSFIAKEQVNGGDLRGAEKSNSRAMVAAERIEEDLSVLSRIKSMAFASIARIESKIGNAQNAAKFFSKAEAIAKLIENSWGNGTSYSIRSPGSRLQLDTFAMLWKLTRRINYDSYYRSYTFADIALAQSQAGMAQDAVKSFPKLWQLRKHSQMTTTGTYGATR